jgi:hypothetical protein
MMPTVWIELLIGSKLFSGSAEQKDWSFRLLMQVIKSGQPAANRVKSEMAGHPNRGLTRNRGKIESGHPPSFARDGG